MNRWIQSKAKKDDVDEAVSKYDGEYWMCTETWFNISQPAVLADVSLIQHRGDCATTPQAGGHKNCFLSVKYIWLLLLLPGLTDGTAECQKVLNQTAWQKSLKVVFFKSIHRAYSVSQKKIPPPPEDLWQYFQNGWEFFNQILRACYAFLSTLDYEFVFKYLQV